MGGALGVGGRTGGGGAHWGWEAHSGWEAHWGWGAHWPTLARALNSVCAAPAPEAEAALTPDASHTKSRTRLLTHPWRVFVKAGQRGDGKEGKEKKGKEKGGKGKKKKRK